MDNNPSKGFQAVFLQSFQSFDREVSVDDQLEPIQTCQVFLNRFANPACLTEEIFSAAELISNPRRILGRMETEPTEAVSRFLFHLLRGVFFWECGDLPKAGEEFDDSRRAATDDRCQLMLVRALTKCRFYSRVVDIARQDLSDQRSNADVEFNIASAHFAKGEYRWAIKSLLNLIKKFGHKIEFLILLGWSYLAEKELKRSGEQFQAAVVLEPMNFEAAYGKAVVDSENAKHDGPQGQWFGGQHDPADQIEAAFAFFVEQGDIGFAKKMIEQMEGGKKNRGCSDRWQKVLEVHQAGVVDEEMPVLPGLADYFDHRASDWDANSFLGDHQVSNITKDILARVFDKAQGDLQVIDLGCGTGVSGKALKRYSESLTGLDVSKKMISKARRKTVYSQLVQEEMTEFLRSNSSSYDLIFSFDVFSNFGRLDHLLKLICNSLKEGGRVIFSLRCGEMKEEPGFCFRAGVGFEHTVGYVLTTLANGGLQPRLLERRVPRLDGDEPEYHFVTVAEKIPPAEISLDAAKQAFEIRDAVIPDKVALYQKLARNRPGQANPHFCHGNSCLDARDHQAAIQSFQKGLELKKNPEMLNQLGTAFAGGGDLKKAFQVFVEAVECDEDFVPALNNAGRAAHELGHLETAENFIQKVIEKDEATPKTFSCLGCIHRDRGDEKKAMVAFEKSIDLDPNQWDVLLEMGQVWRRQNMIDKAMSCLIRSQQLQPSNPAIYLALGQVNRERGHVTEAGYCFLQASQLSGGNREYLSELLCTMLLEPTVSPEKYLQSAEMWNTGPTVGDSLSVRSRGLNSSPSSAARIGFLMPAAGGYPDRHLMEAIAAEIEQRDNRTDEQCSLPFVFYYYWESVRPPNPPNASWISEGRWRSVGKLTDFELSKIICDDHIDILVDIAGHSHGNRLEMLANKPAPIQILWPGFPGSTGIQGMDFIVADQWTIPEHEAGGYTEEPLRLPSCFTCFIKPDEIPSSQIKPVQRPNELVFGCLSSMQFIGPNVIQCWAKILESVPDSRLVIKNRELSNDSVRERISSLFIEYGIPFSRLLLEGEDAADNASDLLEKIDVGLDPFPCSDFENAFQFLSRGVPVISKSGQRYAGNQTTSLLQNLGLTEFCVQTDEGYLQCARSVANDSSGLADLRLGLPQRVRSSRVCDVPKFVTDLQDLFSKALTQRNR